MADSLLPVTVIMPLFNDARFVGKALESVLTSRRPAEIIVVDNRSTDGSAEVVEAMDIPRLRLLRNAENIGATAARAQARALSTQAYLCHLDSDDWLGPDALAKALASLEAGAADISLFHLVKTDVDGATLREDAPTPMAIDGRKALALSLGRWGIHSPGVYRRQVVDAAAKSFLPHGFSDDELLTRLCFAEAGRIVGNDGRYFYRTNPKPYSYSKIVGQTRTNVRSTALGAERLGQKHPATADMRDVCVRNLAALAVRGLRGEGPMGEVRALDAELRAIEVPWRLRDTPRRAMAGVARLLMAVG